MIARGLLTAAVLALLGWGRLAPLPLLAGSLSLGLLSAWGSRRAGHLHALELVDRTAQASPLSAVPPELKGLPCLVGLLCCASGASPLLLLALWGSAALVLRLLGGVPLRRYLRLLALPGAFLLLGALALAVDLGPAQGAVLALPAPGGVLSVTAESQRRAALTTLRAFGGVSWLYALALTTPMGQILDLLRRLKLPKTLVELMFLTYRYLFLLWELLEAMTQAARCRLGWRDLSAGVRTSGAVAAVLLGRSLGQARRSLAAMEARCWRGDVSLEGPDRAPLTPGQVLASACLSAGLIFMSLWARRGGLLPWLPC